MQEYDEPELRAQVIQVLARIMEDTGKSTGHRLRAADLLICMLDDDL